MVLDAQREPPVHIGPYQVLEVIGRGGMAEVFLGRAPKREGMPELVAIKRIFPHLEGQEQFVRMFIDEARIAAQLHHTSIARIYAFGIDFSRTKGGTDSIFIVMEYVPGLDLRAIYGFFQRQAVHCSSSMAAFVVARICAGLECAHTERGRQGTSLDIIHRDVSPTNALVTFEGEVKLIDFGVAKAAQRLQDTTCGGLKGKVAYMSPEQALGGTVDRRSDIFSAGTLLYELLTGINPFRGDAEMDTLRRVQTAAVTPPSKVQALMSGGLEEICLRALARRPRERYASAGDMAAALEAHCSRTGYGQPQLAEWMQQCFPSEWERIQQVRGKFGEEGTESHEARETSEGGPESLSSVITKPILTGWMEEHSPLAGQLAQPIPSLARRAEEAPADQRESGEQGISSISSTLIWLRTRRWGGRRKKQGASAISAEVTALERGGARRGMLPPGEPAREAPSVVDQSTAKSPPLRGRGGRWMAGATVVVAALVTLGILSFRGRSAEPGSRPQASGSLPPPAEAKGGRRADSGPERTPGVPALVESPRTMPDIRPLHPDAGRGRSVRWANRDKHQARPGAVRAARARLDKAAPRRSVAPAGSPPKPGAPDEKKAKTPRKVESVPL
jgi:serine/threonine-protein kinase